MTLRIRHTLSFCFAAAISLLALAPVSKAQTIASDDAANYIVSANWTNGANAGFGFQPWAIATNGPDFHGTYINGPTNPAYAIATFTNSLGTNYADTWGLFANGTNDINETVAFRGFSNPLGTNTFTVRWGAKGSGSQNTLNSGTVHGYSGFTLRNGNVTNSTADFVTGAQLYLFFRDGNSPSTLYLWDGNFNDDVVSIPGTSFSDLGRDSITNAVQAEITVANDQQHFHMVLKDSVQGRTLYVYDGLLNSAGTIDSVALFCQETTGDQVYNRMQILVPKIPPTLSNIQPPNGSIYLDPLSTSISFEVDSFNSLVQSNLVTVLLNGATQSNLGFNTASPTSQLQVSCASAIAPDTFYTVTVIASDINGNVGTNSFTFNTFLPSDIYIDAYDYNYGSGQFIDNNTPNNGYSSLLGAQGIDYAISDATAINNTAGYRPNDLPQILTLATDSTGDPIDHANLRANSFTAYNIGFTDVGNWENYTRVIPVATNYSIYARAASAGSGQFEMEKLANATATSSNQPSIAIGRVNVPGTGGSKVFSGQLQPLADAYGNTVVLPLSGTTTLRSTAISSRGYNIEYYAVVAVTNATSTLQPYLAIASPAPGSVGTPLAPQISFALANRQATIQAGTIRMYINGSNATAGVTISNNAAGSTGVYTSSANFAPNTTVNLMVTFTNNSNVAITNTWSFTTGTGGGVVGGGLWSGGAGPGDMSWATAANWTGGTPGPGANATFASAGGTTTLSTNNIITTNTTIQALLYNTNNNGYHTTLIQDGVTLLVTNPISNSATPVMQVGGLFNTDNAFSKQVTNTLTGPNGTLKLMGLPSAGLNQLNFQIRQCANPPAPEQVVLDMSGLGTLIAQVGKFYVAQGGSGTYQSNCSARVNLARTNMITCLRANAGQFEVGDSSGGAFTLPGSTLNFGITNALFVDTMRFGKQKATNNLVRFNPDFAALNPSVFIRGTNGLASRLTTLTIGDADTEATVPCFSQALTDWSAGRVDALIGTLIIGRGATTGSDSGFAQGTLAIGGGTIDVLTTQIGVQRAANTATESGVLQLTGGATFSCPGVTLAQVPTAGNPGLVTASINATNATLRANIIGGGGNSILNVNNGSLYATGAVGTVAAPLTTLNLVGANVHFNADAAIPGATVNGAAVTASGTTITIDSVSHVITSPTNIHLIAYTGSDPFSGLTLAPMPSGYSGALVDNAGSIDLTITVSALPPPPKVTTFQLSGTQVILGGTNNAGAGGTYKVLSSTNLTTPLSNWIILSSGNFDGSGQFNVTNGSGTNSQRFYLLQVP
jgi:hypothetical protein